MDSLSYHCWILFLGVDEGRKARHWQK